MKNVNMKSGALGFLRGLNRRDFFKGAGAAAVAGMVHHEDAEAATIPDMRVTTYETIGARPVINCWGTITLLGGSLMLPEVMRAMEEANTQFVYMPELFEGVGRRLAELTGAEWGCVTSGAAGAIFGATAACVAGTDRSKMAKLPDTTGMKNEAIIPKAHMTGYHDATCREIGLKLIQVDSRAEMEQVIGDKTAIVYIWGEISGPNFPGGGNLAYKDIIEVAKKHGVPTMVDAAAERPDVPNYYLESGSDLVCYSGGKCLRGPQSTGLLIGRKDLCQAAVQNMSPFGGVGRPMKVGKEEIMGVLTALDIWLHGRDHEAEFKEWERVLRYISDKITQIPGVKTRMVEPGRPSNVAPTLAIEWDQNKIKLTDEELQTRLMEGYPRVKIAANLGDATHTRCSTVMPYMMRPGDEIPTAQRLYDELSRAAT